MNTNLSPRLFLQEPDRCLKRNRIAALRYGVNAVPVKLLRNPHDIHSTEGGSVVESLNALPETTEEALLQINLGRAQRNPDVRPLSETDVYIHYLEACNSNYIWDRYMFLHPTTLKNVAQDATHGIAFMNSHATGDLSAPAEQPYGKTFVGMYEKYRLANGKEFHRAVMGMYMLRGVKPNGAQGPSTDDWHQMIDGGTTFDVSIGYFGGKQICTVCGLGVMERDPETREYLCRHCPGTHRAMSAEDRQRMEEMGVYDGKAAYWLYDSHTNEVSGVYDGAVPGAGFGKAMSLARERKLTTVDLAEARLAYAPLLAKGEFEESNMDEQEVQHRSLKEAISQGMQEALAALGIRPSKAGVAPGFEDKEEELGATNPSATEQRLAQMEETMKQLQAERDEAKQQLAKQQEQEKEASKQGLKIEAKSKVDKLVRINQILPAEAPGLTALMGQLMLDDLDNPIELEMGESKLSRAGLLLQLCEDRPRHNLTTDLLQYSGEKPLAKLENKAKSPTGPDDSGDEVSDDEKERLMRLSPLGQGILDEKKSGNGTRPN